MMDETTTFDEIINNMETELPQNSGEVLSVKDGVAFIADFSKSAWARMISFIDKNLFGMALLVFVALTGLLYNALQAESALYSLIAFAWPLKLRLILNRWVEYKQKVYNTITLYLLSTVCFNRVILCYHTILFGIRYYLLKIGDLIEFYVPLTIAGLVLSMVLSRLGYGGSVVVACLIFLRVDFMILNMLRFYKAHFALLGKHFPQTLFHKRGMWSQVGKIAQEAASNPQVSAVGLAVGGALVWKTIDAYDNAKTIVSEALTRASEDERAAKDNVAEDERAALAREAEARLREQDRLAEDLRHERALDAEDRRQQRALDAEDRRQERALDAEAKERELDRKAEDRRQERGLDAEAKEKEHNRTT